MSESGEKSGGVGEAASPQRFTHLHLHSEYSLLDGGNRLDKLVARVIGTQRAEALCRALGVAAIEVPETDAAGEADDSLAA